MLLEGGSYVQYIGARRTDIIMHWIPHEIIESWRNSGRIHVLRFTGKVIDPFVTHRPSPMSYPGWGTIQAVSSNAENGRTCLDPR